MDEKNYKNVKVVAVIASAFLLFIIFAAAFAYFGTFNIDLNNNVAVNIYAEQGGDATFTTTAAQLNLQVPASAMSQSNSESGNAVLAAENTATLNVTLKGAEGMLTTCTYNIIYEYDNTSETYGNSVAVTSGADKEITLQVSGLNGKYNYYETERNFNYYSGSNGEDTTDVWESATKRYLVKDAKIRSTGSEETAKWNITGKYYNLDVSQSQLEGKSFTGKIYVDSNYDCITEELPTENGYNVVLTQNGGKEAIEAKGTPDISTLATTNEGMYAAEDDLGTSYYFRGKVNNNWVKFGKYTSDMYYNSSDKTLYNTCPDGGSCTKIASNGDDMYWRIIRINGDNSIRMIYTGVTPPAQDTQYVMTDSNYSTSIGKTPFNTNYNKSEYVGYMYTLGEQHGISTNSTIKTYLDNWYTFTNLSTYYTNNTSTDLLADQIFCNDRNTSSTWESTGSSFNYAANDRFSAGSPSLKCTTKADRFTVDDIVNGNGALINPVGLITLDETLLSGGKGANNSFYLYNNDYYWFGSPIVFKNGYAREYALGPTGDLYSVSVGYASGGVRGVVSLSSNAKLLGSGTYDDVYVVS